MDDPFHEEMGLFVRPRHTAATHSPPYCTLTLAAHQPLGSGFFGIAAREVDLAMRRASPSMVIERGGERGCEGGSGGIDDCRRSHELA